MDNLGRLPVIHDMTTLSVPGIFKPSYHRSSIQVHFGLLEIFPIPEKTIDHEVPHYCVSDDMLIRNKGAISLTVDIR